MRLYIPVYTIFTGLLSISLLVGYRIDDFMKAENKGGQFSIVISTMINPALYLPQKMPQLNEASLTISVRSTMRL